MQTRYLFWNSSIVWDDGWEWCYRSWQGDSSIWFGSMVVKNVRVWREWWNGGGLGKKRRKQQTTNEQHDNNKSRNNLISIFLHAYLLVIWSGVSAVTGGMEWGGADEIFIHGPKGAANLPWSDAWTKQDQSAWKPRRSRGGQAACLPPG